MRRSRTPLYNNSKKKKKNIVRTLRQCVRIVPQLSGVCLRSAWWVVRCCSRQVSSVLRLFTLKSAGFFALFRSLFGSMRKVTVPPRCHSCFRCSLSANEAATGENNSKTEGGFGINTVDKDLCHISIDLSRLTLSWMPFQ